MSNLIASSLCMVSRPSQIRAASRRNNSKAASLVLVFVVTTLTLAFGVPSAEALPSLDLGAPREALERNLYDDGNIEDDVDDSEMVDETVDDEDMEDEDDVQVSNSQKYDLAAER